MKILAQEPTTIDFPAVRASAFPTSGAISLGTDLSLGTIISKALDYVFIIAGLMLLFFLIAGGFKMMTGAADPKDQEGASKQITNALIGFFILFAAYWLVQIIEVILGISILK